MGMLTLQTIFVLVLSIFLLSDNNANALQIPQFLKKKYGNQYGQSISPSENNAGQSQPIKTSYIKTKTDGAGYSPPSAYQYGSPSGAYQPYGTGPPKSPYASKTNYKVPSNILEGCGTSYPKVLNAGVRCSHYSSTCKADCIPDYQFPNGQTHITFKCENGKWIIPGNEWSAVPPCQPTCLPQCQNNGICIGPNQCQCPENYSGPQCQFENKPCLTPPHMVRNSKRLCRGLECTIECLLGHVFPDGSQIATMVCKNGMWLPTREKWVTLPDCEPTCEPPCLNRGLCLSFNVCHCPQNYRGPQCQYSADVCSPKKLPTNGGYNCSGDMESFRCSISCPSGIHFEFEPEPVYTCYYSTGVFMPTPVPKCIFPESLEIIPQPGSSYNYYLPNKTYHHGSSGSGYIPHRVTAYPDFEPGTFIYPNAANINKYPSTLSPDFNNETSIDIVFPGEFVNSAHQYITVEEKLPKPGSCFHWGSSHYKTFDGKVYSFDSTCAYLLVRDSVDDTFSIITQNHQDCYFDSIHCHVIIRIYLQDKEYFLKKSSDGAPIFATRKKTLPIPGQLPGIRVEMSAHYIVVSLDILGVKIRWDGQQLVHVEVKENLWNRTEGLCGVLDEDPGNDIINKDGQVTNNVLSAVLSWKTDDLDHPCEDVPVAEHICQDTGVKNTLADKATLFCKKILADRRFASCQKVIDISSLMDACRWDYCNCKENDHTLCACETLNVYVRDCTQKGVKGLANWRDDDTCPMQCTGGKVYKSCGPPKGQPVCGATTEIPDDDEPCVEGCYCPEGTVLHENKCISKDKCPCRLRGKYFKARSSVPKDCNSCTCNNGEWQCTQVTCGARCSAIGDPHYITFDGKKYDFMGQCSYYLVKSDNFSIEAENVACAGSISEAMNLPASISSGLPSCTKTVTIKMNGQTIKLKQNHEIVVNGQDITRIPYSTSGINIKSVSSIFLLAKLPNGVEVWWDGMTRVYVDLPSEFRGKTNGLCGTFNNNQKDDFLTPENDVEQAVIPFANKWKTSEKCNDVPDVLSSHPCDKNIHKKATAEKHCSKLKSNLFKDCHPFVDPDQYYQDCMYDMCSCELKTSKCLCPIVSSYATDCSQKRIKIDWRAEIRECGVHCPGGQIYQVCGNSCTRTCFDIAVDPECRVQCAEGCNCPDGQAMDDNGECILIGQCKCQHEGLEFPPGYKEVRPAPNGPELCTCSNALWQCFLASPEDLTKYPQASDLQSLCDAAKNMEFTTCEPVEPITCRNMHDPEYFSASVCHSGCQCKAGYVLDTISKMCVKPTQCPCHHGGKSYKENATVQSDCNTCLCQNGKWECTDRQCTAECSAWGDSHYKTFDGKHYDYQGQCDYVLAKGSFEANSFDLTIQNVPCGSLGTACSKSITIKTSSGDTVEKITLSRNKPVPKYKTFKHAIVRERGLFAIIEAPDMGLTVHWDKGTRVYVKVDPRWKDRTKGLCGNYNDNDADDFQTPSGGLVEVSPNIFGDSWRLQSYCPDALDVVDTCNDRPDRKSWSVKKCGILKSGTFSPCHSEVPVDYYFEKCVFDSCACDQGGDCECLCTAIAAYAQACNNRGIPIKWRSQQMCPMQCDQRCTTYSSCISTCPEETCDNILTNKQILKTCNEDTCIEGCSPKPCPPGYIYTNSSLLECVAKNVCKPICLEINGVTYYEGDLIEEDECHSCYCSLGDKICKGQPCTTLAEITTPQYDRSLGCKSGWTPWINKNKSKKSGKKKEREPVPTEVVLRELILQNNLIDSSRCNITQMVDIECRTVEDYVPAKETGLNVECSLEKGLVCLSNAKGQLCPDFEIRVLCQCEKESTTPIPVSLKTCTIDMLPKDHPTDCYKFYECAPGLEGNEWVEKTCGPSMMYNPNTRVCDFKEAVIAIKESCGEMPFTEKIVPDVGTAKCPDGTIFQSCAIKCDRLCLYYLYLVRKKGLCQGKAKCEEGCVSAEKTLECPRGTFWADEHTCVSIDECMCISEDNEMPLKPGQIYQKEGCQECQCIDNSISCHPGSCVSTSTTLVTEPTVLMHTMPPVIIPTSVTPPPLCDESRYINLIQGDQPLLDEAFNASSVLNPSFAPSNSRLNSRVTETSGGSWAPQYSNQNQYLEIDLGQQEPVYGAIVRGSPLYDEYVTSYKVLYSPDGHTFYYILNHENYPIIFRGSIDTTTPIKQIFETPIEAKIIRINPQTWNNGISLRVELIGCAELTTKPVPQSARKKFLPQYCDDDMGYAMGDMSEQQVTTSSELSPDYGKAQLKLNSVLAWQPLTNSPTEWILFDFLEPRNITGLVTRGGKNGWVTAYKIQYSQDKEHWNPILDENMEDRIFVANYDNSSPHVNNFDLPICTQYVKIIPVKWQNNIQMRIEIRGCYKPYPIITTILPPPTPTNCNICPGVEISEIEKDVCRCLVNFWWDGQNCVNRTQCPCFIGHIVYAVGKIYKKDCSECICKLGGIEHCTPQKCDPCPKGLKSTITSTCACICQPCPTNTTLCPTSNICINSIKWCDSIQDCPDDEVNCPNIVAATQIVTTLAPTTTTKKPVKECPIISCQPGYKKVILKTSKKTSYLSNMVSGYSKTKSIKTYAAVKTSYKGVPSRNSLQRPPPVVSELAVEEEICPEYKCVLNKPPPNYIGTQAECPPIVCQYNYIPVLDDLSSSRKSKLCPTYSCYPPPEPDAICNVTGKTFNTFDDTTYKYEICNHILARDLEADHWDVSLKKNCSIFSCTRDLVIRHQHHLVVLHSDLSIEFDGYKYTVEQIKNIGAHDQAFVLSQLGNTVLFVSNRYGFWIIWNKLGDVKLGVVHKLVEKVDGLCGYFNDNPDDDKRKPNGSPARTTVEFGDNWALPNDQPAICEAKVCPLHIQNKAWEMCNRVKEQSLSPCAKVIDIESFISRCLETTCTCLQNSLDNHTEEEQCRCQAMQSFVVDCLSADHTLNAEISDWRMQQDCPTSCEAPLVYHDCYQRKCEPTCRSINDPTVCPKINNICFPGCYCPSGYVRKDDTCIKPSDCRDCECNVLPHLQYVTYDENNFTVTGNCVYIMSRDVLEENQEKHKFQVLVTNHPCKKKPDKMCVGKITILYEGHKIHILLDEFRNKLKLIVDSERILDFDDIAPWAKVRETATKHYKILLIAVQVEVSVYYPSLGMSVKAPSHKYGGKLEGLCGDCNTDPEDDIKLPNGKKPIDIEDFALSWLYENLPGGQTKDQCQNLKEEECLPIPKGLDPCEQLLDSNKFGQCVNILDPTLFIEWCRKDTCGNHPEQSCTAIEAFARDCASSGFCINWRNEYCPASTCPPDQFYDPCGSSSPDTCETIKEKDQNAKKKIISTEGCYCPEGKVSLNNTCILPKDCEVCDEEGHHPGDIWNKDKCTTCRCEGTSLKCETQHCAGPATICKIGFNAIKLPNAEEDCCDKYACVPEPTAGPTCETPQKLVCGRDQILKLETKPNGCQTFICECKPANECETLNMTTAESLEPGYIKDIDDSGCCAVINLLCKPELCPPPIQCPQYYSLKENKLEGKCCSHYLCEAPKDRCIFETEFTAAEKGGQRRLVPLEKQTLLKAANETWKDGPCRECKCSYTSAGNYQPICSETECSSIVTHSDYADYELVLRPVYGQCCADIIRKACKYNNKVYEVGQKWPKDGDYCTTLECLESDNNVMKEIQVKSCDKNCDIGFMYNEPSLESRQCCGSCKQVSCVNNGIVHPIGEEWSSEDHCVNYYCSNVNGSILTQAVMVDCPKISEDLDDFVIETYPIEDECCPKHVKTACKVNGKVYKVGESWPSPDGDKCKTYTCFENENYQIGRQEKIETCKKECAKGWEYRESKTACCGECVQVACVLDGEIKLLNETWASPDNCTKFTCEQLRDQFSVASTQETCPEIGDCPKNKTYIKGCCKFCNITSEAQKLCTPQALLLEKTKGLLNYTVPLHGVCVNTEPIPNFTECIGSCPSSTYFNIKTAMHESVCDCCQAIEYMTINIELTCSGGEKWTKKMSVPSKCGCERCSGNKSSSNYFTKNVKAPRAK